MLRKEFFFAIVVIFVLFVLLFVTNIRGVNGQETIYIKADGSVEGTTSIYTTDNVTYHLVADINTTIVIERDNIVFDGGEHVISGNETGNGGTGLYGTGSETGLWVIGDGNVVIARAHYRTNVTVENVQVRDFDIGIYLYGCQNCTISDNNITSNHVGIQLDAANNLISRNNIVGNFIGLWVMGGGSIYDFNWIYHNNFIGNSAQTYWDYGYAPQVLDNGYPSGGNFWSDYNGADLYSGQYQNVSGSDGIGDTPYDMRGGLDYYPLMHAFVPLFGDLNHDDRVDIYDAVLAVKAFGSTPASPNWNPAADLNGDGQVDIFDMILLARNLGEVYHP